MSAPPLAKLRGDVTPAARQPLHNTINHPVPAHNFPAPAQPAQSHACQPACHDSHILQPHRSPFRFPPSTRQPYQAASCLADGGSPGMMLPTPHRGPPSCHISNGPRQEWRMLIAYVCQWDTVARHVRSTYWLDPLIVKVVVNAVDIPLLHFAHT